MLGDIKIPRLDYKLLISIPKFDEFFIYVVSKNPKGKLPNTFGKTLERTWNVELDIMIQFLLIVYEPFGKIG